MAISTGIGASSGYYDPNFGRQFHSEAEYRRYMEDLHYRQQLEMARQQSMYNQYATASNGAISGAYVTGNNVVVQKPKPPDALSFLNKIDNKVLLTGEAS